MHNQQDPPRIEWTLPHRFRQCIAKSCVAQPVIGDHCRCGEKENAPIHSEATR